MSRMNLSKDDMPPDLPEEKAAFFAKASLAQSADAPGPPSRAAAPPRTEETFLQSPQPAGGISLRRIMRFGIQAFAIAGCIAAAAALAMYLLALQALRDLADTPGVKQHASAAGGMSVAAMHDGSAKLRMDDGSAMELGGHMAPIKSAEIIGSGAHLMTSDATGHIRFTALDAAHGLHDAGLAGLSAKFYDTVWRPSYGMSIARWSLDWVAQVLPLYIPDSRKGGRGRIFRDCDVCPEMVEIEPGLFFMGSPLTEWERSSDEGPRKLVTIPQRFAAGRFEVTFDEWDACVKEGACRPNFLLESISNRGRRPVNNVSWLDAQEFLRWLNGKVQPLSSRIRGGPEPYRLLTEAEWEYAARAGSTTAFASGNALATGEARFSLEQVGTAGSPIEVGTYASNAFGLYDMHGNVWEWVSTCYNTDYSEVPTTAQGSQSGANVTSAAKSCERGLRGGAWNSLAGVLRSASRGGEQADLSSASTGFRVARTVSP